MEPQPSIFIFGLRIDEGMIALTDLLVAAVCFFSYRKLTQLNQKDKTFLLFRLYFLFLGLATFWGAFFTHAFLYALSDPWKVPGWFMSMISMTMISFFSIIYTKEMTGRIGFYLKALLIVELIAAISVTLLTINFRWASIHSAFGLMAIVAPLHALAWWKNRDRASRLIVLALLIFCLSGVIFSLQLSPHRWFIHVDVTHVLLALAAYVFYRSGRILGVQRK